MHSHSHCTVASVRWPRCFCSRPNPRPEPVLSGLVLDSFSTYLPDQQAISILQVDRLINTCDLHVIITVPTVSTGPTGPTGPPQVSGAASASVQCNSSCPDQIRGAGRGMMCDGGIFDGRISQQPIHDEQLSLVVIGNLDLRLLEINEGREPAWNACTEPEGATRRRRRPPPLSLSTLCCTTKNDAEMDQTDMDRVLGVLGVLGRAE